MPDPELGAQRTCAEFVPPVARLGAHVAALGMRFAAARQWPEAYGVGAWRRPIGR